MNDTKFNILFLYASAIDPLKGGIESVTYELSNYLSSIGCSCYYLSLNRSESNDSKQFFLPNDSFFLNEENKMFLIDFIKDKKIDILINQGGFDKEGCQFSYIVKDYGVKLISCLHNSLLDRIRYFDISYYNTFKKRKIQFLLKYTRNRFVKKLLFSMYRLKYLDHYKKLCEYSNRVLLLSDSFRDDFSFFIGDLPDNVCAMPNPIPSKIYNSESNTQKDKIVLYVGRIDMQQKRPDLLLQIWSMVYKEHKDWKLLIVGGGEDLNYLKTYASSLHLENVFFEGNQNPVSYYQKASIFCMTSSYEGFGIVLIEAMNMKVVPIAFESFSTVRDIIDNNVNGVLIPPFNVESYAGKLSELMSDNSLRDNFSNNAYLKSQQFQLDVIGNKWLNLFTSLIKDNVR